MKVFEFAGVIFNADNVCTIQKVTVKSEKFDTEEKEYEKVPAFQVVTVAGGINFTFKTEKERDEKFNQLLIGGNYGKYYRGYD
jgi:hypothetical protein